MLQQTREDLIEESDDIKISKRSECYAANIITGGIVTTALIYTDAEVTCLSEEFVNNNKERLQDYPTLPVNGVAIIGPKGGKAIRLSKQIYTDVQLPDTLIQVVFLVVPKLSRPCIIGIDLLDELKSKINLESKKISFPHLESSPSLKIVNEEIATHKARVVNHLEKREESVDIHYEEIKKIERGNNNESRGKKSTKRNLMEISRNI